MSHFAAIKLEFKDENVLLAALTNLGLTPIVHRTPTELVSRWGNKESHCAHIVIPRDQLKIGADIGFLRESDGNYSLVADSWELKGENRNFQQRLAAEYAAQMAVKVTGSSVKSREFLSNGDLQIRLRPPVTTSKVQQHIKR